MSPIRPENRDRYPRDWPAISRRIRERAGQRCECLGECRGERHVMWNRLIGLDPDVTTGRCPNVNGKPSEFTGSLVVLTVAHLNHTPEDCRDDNLKAMCQACHLNYDRDHHAETAARTRAEAQASAGQGVLL